jgi:hypothetical protein
MPGEGRLVAADVGDERRAPRCQRDRVDQGEAAVVEAVEQVRPERGHIRNTPKRVSSIGAFSAA